jgi:hypothetical protein
VRENRMLRLTWRELEPWPWWNCEPTEQSKELVWKPSTYSARASSRPYWGGGDATPERVNAPYSTYLSALGRYTTQPGGTRSEKGNRWVERVLSLRHPCRIRGRPTFPILVEAVSCLFKGG